MIKFLNYYGIAGAVKKTEVSITKGLNTLTFNTDMPENAARELHVRVRAAIKYRTEFSWPKGTIVVSGDWGGSRCTIYDLPTALMLLEASGQTKEFTSTAAIGELSLTGEVRPVPGVRSMLEAARDAGIETVIVPAANFAEASRVGINVIPVYTLLEAVERTPADVTAGEESAVYPFGFDDIKGLDDVKQQFTEAIRARKNVLLVGAPGTGKTMLARRGVSVMEPLYADVQAVLTRVYSCAGLLQWNRSVVCTRPFRAPHHTCSTVAITGGGTLPRPGEASLAHAGILYLDEIIEFPRQVLNTVLRAQKDKQTVIPARYGEVVLPADFLLVGAMNPCPCGFKRSEKRVCTCSADAVSAYMERAKRFLHAFDMRIDIPYWEAHKQ